MATWGTALPALRLVMLLPLVSATGLACMPSAPRPPLAAASSEVPRVGFLSFAAPGQSVIIDQFQRGLRDLGYVEGQNIIVEYRYASGSDEQAAAQAQELASLPIRVLVAASTPAIQAAKAATSTIPIVMAISGDPIAAGFVNSLARPGGNITGLSMLDAQSAGKRLEYLREAAPHVAQVGVIWNPSNPDKVKEFQETQSAAKVLGLKVVSLELRAPDGLEAVLEAARQGGIDGLVVLGDPLTTRVRAPIVEFAAQQRLPSMYQTPEFTEAGGLMAYGANRDALPRRAAAFVDRILKGAKPDDLPVEQPMHFLLVINRGTARALGIEMPLHLLYDATHVID